MDTAKVLLELSDLANCVAGDFHTLHLNVVGIDFDSLHKKALKKYYEEAADDYDSLAEAARRKPWRIQIPSQNESAKRIGYKSFEPAAPVTRDIAIQRVDLVLEGYLDAMNTVFNALNKVTECPGSQGLASYLQDRLNYWHDEWGFFNASRIGE
jgi:DNA-binding ferritin-like protein